MLDWLQKTLASAEELPIEVLIPRLLAAAICGAIAAGIYAWTHRRDESFTFSFLATLVLLSILVATVTQVIGNNQARAFGLVGALAIVRFRTVVEDTRDTAFVMLAVIVGMAAGAGQTVLALAALAFCAAAAILLQDRRRPAASEMWTLVIRAGAGQDPAELVQSAFKQHVASARLIATSTARQGAAIEANWVILLRPGSSPIEVLSQLNRVEGIQNVELRRQ